DRHVAEPLGAEAVVQAERRVEVTAAGADALADDEDARVPFHLFGEAPPGPHAGAPLRPPGLRPSIPGYSAYTFSSTVAGSGYGLFLAHSTASSAIASTSRSIAASSASGAPLARSCCLKRGIGSRAFQAAISSRERQPASRMPSEWARVR